MQNGASIVSASVRGAAGACVLLAGLILPSGTAAQSTPASPATRTPASERDSTAPSSREQDPQQADAKQKEEAEKKQDDKVGFRWKGYPSLHLGKGTHVDLRARVQLDARGADSPGNDSDEPETDFARRRIAIEGEIRGVVAFELDRELEGENAWRDVYANYKQFDFVQVQGGKFKLPFSLDENTSPTNLDFVYRSLAARVLAPGRDRGVMVHGRVLDRIVRYELGVFDHDGRNARSRNLERVYGDQALAGRVVVQPFRSSKSILTDLQVGAAFTSSDLPEGTRSLRGTTTFEETFFDPDLWVLGRRERTGFEFRWRPGPFSLKSEYMRVTTERRGQSVEDSDLSPLLATGWYVSGTWAITGENKADGLNKPRRPFMRGGFGALEVAARIEDLKFTSAASDGVPSLSIRADLVEASSDRVTTIGASWYLNQWIKIQLNAIREALANPERRSLAAREPSWSFVTRFQFTM
jgi:phosphate-selective porin OprO/OprP